MATNNEREATDVGRFLSRRRVRIRPQTAAESRYPATVAEVLRDGRKYDPQALRLLREFRRSKPWRGKVSERLAKLRALNANLAAVYGMTAPYVEHAPRRRCSSYYSPAFHRIVLCGQLSVVTFLHEFGHARGWRSERKVCGWSINLFRRVFPRSYARLEHRGHTLVRPDRRPRRRS